MASLSLVFSLYLIETLLTLIDYKSENKRVAKASDMGIDYDKRTYYQVLQDLKIKGIDVAPAVKPTSHIITNGIHINEFSNIYPLGGIANKKTLYCNENGYYVSYTSDRYGFNNPNIEWSVEHPDFALVGDSFANGACVYPDSNIAGVIRSETKSSVINVGMGGNGPLIKLATLKEYIEKKRPKKVLWIYFENTTVVPAPSRLYHEKTSDLLMEYLDPYFSQNLIDRQPEVNDTLVSYVEEEVIRRNKKEELKKKYWYTYWFRLGKVRELISFNSMNLTITKGNDIDQIDPMYARILKEARDRTARWGGELVFVYLPEFSRYSSTRSHGSYRRRDDVLSIVKGLEIPVIDIHKEVFANHPDPLSLFPFRMYGHYNPEGYAEVAKAIVKSVQSYEQDE
jgi:hypothetical protein